MAHTAPHVAGAGANRTKPKQKGNQRQTDHTPLQLWTKCQTDNVDRSDKTKGLPNQKNGKKKHTLNAQMEHTKKTCGKICPPNPISIQPPKGWRIRVQKKGWFQGLEAQENATCRFRGSHHALSKRMRAHTNRNSHKTKA